MARYAGGGKNAVESCRSVDVLRWNKLGYLRSPRRFSWAWTRDGKQVASINVETCRHSVTLKYRSRSHGEDWSDVEQRIDIEWTPCRFGGERPWFVCSVASNGMYCGRTVTKLYGVGARTGSFVIFRAHADAPIPVGSHRQADSSGGTRTVAWFRSCLIWFPIRSSGCAFAEYKRSPTARFIRFSTRCSKRSNSPPT